MASNHAIIKDANLEPVPDSAFRLPAPWVIPSGSLMWKPLQALFPIGDLYVKEIILPTK